MSRYTHCVAISNRRLILGDEAGVTIRYNDYVRNGDARHRTMTLAADDVVSEAQRGETQRANLAVLGVCLNDEDRGAAYKLRYLRSPFAPDWHAQTVDT